MTGHAAGEWLSGIKNFVRSEHKVDTSKERAEPREANTPEHAARPPRTICIPSDFRCLPSTLARNAVQQKFLTYKTVVR